MKHKGKNNAKTFTRKMFYIILAGGNLADPIQQINFAKRELRNLSINGSILQSSLYKTKAWGNIDQPDFFNQVFAFKSTLPPLFVMKQLLKIEERKGRKRKEKWGARILDLDMLYCGKQKVNSAQLIVPHPEIQNRRFCLVPLAELLPKFIHPTLRLMNSQLLKQCKDDGFVEKY
ncbi:MAG: 2-amino-4-hydroxy-6-hydroxymethyldihydropteridine diphosphokinase [Bacteroidia bacterium]|nr:2-amino-4-hydroxy-6-hydroxymethyldihydropteridine diphosphokinase [Bacteroidia bacterium]